MNNSPSRCNQRLNSRFLKLSRLPRQSILGTIALTLTATAFAPALAIAQSSNQSQSRWPWHPQAIPIFPIKSTSSDSASWPRDLGKPADTPGTGSRF